MGAYPNLCLYQAIKVYYSSLHIRRQNFLLSKCFYKACLKNTLISVLKYSRKIFNIINNGCWGKAGAQVK